MDYKQIHHKVHSPATAPGKLYYYIFRKIIMVILKISEPDAGRKLRNKNPVKQS